MDANSIKANDIFTLKQDLLDRIESLLSNELRSASELPDYNMKQALEKRLKSATLRYRITRPLSIIMGVLFTLICLAQMAELTFFGKWENSALFLFLAFSFTISTLNQRRELEQYKQLLYLLNMLERLESIEINTAKV